jgi:hypothetical protein
LLHDGFEFGHGRRLHSVQTGHALNHFGAHIRWQVVQHIGGNFTFKQGQDDGHHLWVFATNHVGNTASIHPSEDV